MICIWVMLMNNENTNIIAAANYIAAMIDGEGYINDVKYRISNTRIVSISNTNTDILKHITKCLDILGITYKIYTSNGLTVNKLQIYRVSIHGKENFLKVKELIPIQCGYKKERLDNILASYKDNYNCEPLSKEVLYNLYIKRRMSTRAIGIHLKVSHAKVQRWLNKHNIKRLIHNG